MQLKKKKNGFWWAVLLYNKIFVIKYSRMLKQVFKA